MSADRKDTEILESNASEMETLARDGLQMARDAGADDAKIVATASFTKRLVVENKNFTLANSQESRKLGILVHKDGKKGSSSINTITGEALERSIQDALALARYSVPDEALTLATPEDAPAAKKLPFLFDEALCEMDLDELQGLMKDTLGRLVKDSRVALDRFEMEISSSYHGLHNTKGVHQSESQTLAEWVFFGMAREGEEVTGFDYDGQFSFNKDHIKKRLEAGADQFVERVLGNLHPKQGPSYKGAVLLSPRAVQDILLEMAIFHASGRSVMDGKSRWDSSVGERVMSSQLTLRDEPHDPELMGATGYDGDGVPTRPTPIIDKGVLSGHLHDCYSAKRLGTKTTGFAGGPFGLTVEAGTESLADITSRYKDLLLVDRFSGNSDPVKGDFSGVAKSSRLYKDGDDMGPVNETMIAGNFFDIADAVLAVSRETRNESGSLRSPYVLVDGVSVSGS